MSKKNTKGIILVTGVAGLLGSHFSTYLLDKKYNVIGIDNLSGGYINFVDKRLIENKKFYKIDLNDTKSLEKIFKKNDIDYVYHFAAYAAEGLSPFIRNFNYTNNLLCSVNVINNCIKYNIKKIIFTSSMAVYGKGKPPFKENQTPQPEDPYGIAKYAVEMDLKQAYKHFNLRYSIIRPHNVIGVNQNIWDKYRNVIGIWIRESIAHKPINIYGDGKQKRAFSDIKYYLKPFELLMYNFDGEIFNIGADQDFELNDIAKIVQKTANKLGYYPEIKYLETRKEVKNAYCNHDKAKKVLKFKDNTNIEKTTEDMFKWAMKIDKKEVKKIKYEIEKNIYSYWK